MLALIHLRNILKDLQANSFTYLPYNPFTLILYKIIKLKLGCSINNFSLDGFSHKSRQNVNLLEEFDPSIYLYASKCI